MKALLVLIGPNYHDKKANMLLCFSENSPYNAECDQLYPYMGTGGRAIRQVSKLMAQARIGYISQNSCSLHQHSSINLLFYGYHTYLKECFIV